MAGDASGYGAYSYSGSTGASGFGGFGGDGGYGGYGGEGGYYGQGIGGVGVSSSGTGPGQGNPSGYGWNYSGAGGISETSRLGLNFLTSLGKQIALSIIGGPATFLGGMINAARSEYSNPIAANASPEAKAIMADTMGSIVGAGNPAAYGYAGLEAVNNPNPNAPKKENAAQPEVKPTPQASNVEEKMRKRRGYTSTLLTGPLGVTSGGANVARKTLLPQGNPFLGA